MVKIQTIHIIVSVFCLHVVVISYDPILYAVDIGDGNGLILLKKLALRCLYYKSIKTTANILLRFNSGQWEITQGAKTSVSNNGCGLIGSGTLLFTQEGEDMRNGSWVNVQTNTAATNFSVYALEDCTTYKGAFIDADFNNGQLITDSSLCQKRAQDTGRLWEPRPGGVNLFTTEQIISRDGLSIQDKILEIWCHFRNVEILTWAVLKLHQTDENASVTVRGSSCVGGVTGRSAKIVNINEALVFTSVDSSGETETSIYWVIFGAGATLVVIVVLFIYFVTKNKDLEPHVIKHTANNSNHIILKKGKDLGSKINLVAENEDKIKEDFMKAEEKTEGSQKHPTHNAKLVRNEEHNWSDVVPYDSNMVTIGKKLGIDTYKLYYLIKK